jgi:quercetin dioxygenase-like cupin family protein
MTVAERQSFPWVDADEGVKRRVLAHTKDAMTVEVVFEAGAEGAVHSHPHLQTIYVRSGTFDFVVDRVEQRVTTGDSLVIPSGVDHGCRALEAGSLIDSFSPRRDDFL